MRVAAGLTQEELAERSGLSVRGISDLERGARTHPRRDTLELLCDALELDAHNRAALAAAARARGTASATIDTRMGSPTSLPRPHTPLIGREEVVAALTTQLQRPDVRLLTLTGPGGVGKTRLALRLAEELESHFHDGILFVSLASLRDPGLVARTIAHAVGLVETQEDLTIDRLRAYLGNGRTLLVLDNFEHLLEATSVVSELLAGCPNLKILATSRSLLRVTVEHTFDVPPLSLPNAADLAEPARFVAVPSVALFLERRAALLHDQELTEKDAHAVVEICQRLDGLPLAIELAAARGRHFSLIELAGRLSRRLSLLTNGPRDLPPRQQALRDTITWSYELLLEPEQRTFRRLAVFVGGWTVNSAERFAGGDGVDVVQALAGLVDASLVRVNFRHDLEARYEMLETIREFAEERLTAEGEKDAARESHAWAVLAFTAEAERGLQGGERTIWSIRARDELGNVRAALRWSLDSGDPDRALAIAGNLDWFWDAVGRDREGWSWSREALEQAGINRQSWAYARALNAGGALAWNMGEFALSAGLLGESVALLHTFDDPRSLGQALMNLGLTLHYQGKLDDALRAIRDSVANFEAIDDPWGLAIARFSLAEVLAAHDRDGARDSYQRSLALFRTIDEPWGIAHAISGLGGLAMRERDYQSAQTLMAEALDLRRTIGNPHAIATSLTSLGELARQKGEMERAAALLADGLHRFRLLGDSEHTAWALYNLGLVSLHGRNLHEAMNAFDECLMLRVSQGNRVQIANAISAVAAVVVLAGEVEGAARLSGAAETLRMTASGDVRVDVREGWELDLAATLRTMFGDDRAAVLLAEGQALSLDAAVGLARNLMIIQENRATQTPSGLPG